MNNQRWVKAALYTFVTSTVLGFAIAVTADVQTGIILADLYTQQVDRRLEVPGAEQRRYAEDLSRILVEAGLGNLSPQYFVLVDRNVQVQAAMIFWKSKEGQFLFIGASPVSTGKPGQFEYFETQVGVFDHSLDNPDFRAEGTRNEFGILGYGRKGMRVYDFGWVKGPKGWGDGKDSVMRFQMHSTDPGILEPRLGSVQSKGCIRIPASMNAFIDHYGILDADYERGIASGKTYWVLSPNREPTPWSGRYLVVVDSRRDARPSWSQSPLVPAKTR